MDRPLTTSDAAIGGNPGTGANWTTAAQPGHFHGRQVQLQVQAAPTMPGLRFATGYGLEHAQAYAGTRLMPALAAPGSAGGAGAFTTPNTVPWPCGASQPVPPAPRFAWHPHVDPGPTGIRDPQTYKPVADGAATGTGTPLTGQNRTAPSTLSPHLVQSSYRNDWRRFIEWCNHHNLQYLPASPETITAFLQERATQVSSSTLIRTRSAIGSTHRTAMLKNPCNSELVEVTMKELLGSPQKCHQRSSPSRRDPVDSATLTAIRQVALERRNRPSYVVPISVTEQRKRIDAALCSLVLGAGLGYAEAAALDWSDLATKDDGTRTVKVRKRAAFAAPEVVISEQAFADLTAISRPEEATGSIFALDAQQISNRLKSVADAAGFNLRTRSFRNEPSNGNATQSCSQALSSQDRDTFHWRLFVSWCASRSLNSLPATADTTSTYLTSLATAGERTLARAKRAIRRNHLEAGHDDPCATEQTRETLRGMRHQGPRLIPETINASVLAEVRAKAFEPRRLGRGHETEAAARQRGLLDIALCSVMHAAELTLTQASELRWSDTQACGEREMQLSVRNNRDPLGSNFPVTLTGQVVCDLQAIRGDAKPGDKIFGLAYSALRNRAKAALAAADLANERQRDQCAPQHQEPAP